MSLDLGEPVDRRVYLVETYFTTTYLPGPPSPEPPGATAPMSFKATAGFATGGRDFHAPTSGALPPYDFRLANDDFVSEPGDPNRPSQFWAGKVINPGVLTRSAKLTPTGAGAVEISTGTITIDNTDGEFDTVLDQYQAVSQQIAIRYGHRGWDWRDFVTLWLLRINGIGITEAECTLEVVGTSAFAQNLYPVAYYNGTGGIGGSASLAGVQRPVVFGQVWNYAPVRIDPTLLIYQMHAGPIAAVTGVFDGGIPLTFAANHASYAALAGATIAAGAYATCLAEGCLRLGGTPVFTPTVHMQGRADAGTTTRTIASTIAVELEGVLGIEIDNASFDAIPARTAGWVFTDAFSYQDVINRFVGDVGFIWGSLTSGPLSCAALTAPIAGGASERDFIPVDIMALARVSLPSGYEATHKRRVVDYQRNWTVQAGGQLGGTAVDSGYRQREWKTVSASSTAVVRNAIDPPVLQTSLALTADAQALADYLIGLHGVRRQMYSLETKIFGPQPTLGGQVTVTYPRYGLVAGRPYRVIESEYDYGQGLATFLLWG